LFLPEMPKGAVLATARRPLRRRLLFRSKRPLSLFKRY
jgi:hypothetical protein